MTKNRVHFALFGGCKSFVSACTMDWCYNTGLWDAPRTTDEQEVTCLKCKKVLNAWEDMRSRYLEHHVKPMLELMRRCTAGEFATHYVLSESDMHSLDSQLKAPADRVPHRDGDRCYVRKGDASYDGYYYLNGEWHLAEPAPTTPDPCPTCGGSGVVSPPP